MMNNDLVKGRPWASFCMSTYNRPEFLRSQVSLLLQQSFTDFEIVIADNDPSGSGKAVVDAFNDARIKYQCNGENLGMVKSFNRSVDRAMGEYIVMVTDDDPVFFDLLEVFHTIITGHPGYSFYGGLKRTYKEEGELELIGGDDFIREFLDLDKTSELVWSGCLLEREALLQIGKLPDYGSPHLVDHAMLAMVGAIGGGVVVNKMYSTIAYHQTNFSKSNFDYYYNSCAEFYRLMEGFIQQRPLYEENKKVIVDHLGKWFISCIFSLLNYFRSAANHDEQKLAEIKIVAEKILRLPFMQPYRFKYRAKSIILSVKFGLGIKK